MYHIHGRAPEGIEWRNCRHKPTLQRFVVLTEDANVETPHGTMVAREGDVLMEGANGKFYVLTRAAFDEVYDLEEP